MSMKVQAAGLSLALVALPGCDSGAERGAVAEPSTTVSAPEAHRSDGLAGGSNFGFACGIQADEDGQRLAAGLVAAPEYIGVTAEAALTMATRAGVPLRIEGDSETGCRKGPAPPSGDLAPGLVRVFLSNGAIVVAARNGG
jgi:hypothetical protein